MKAVRKEHEQQGYTGRTGPALPRVRDASLFVLRAEAFRGACIRPDAQAVKMRGDKRLIRMHRKPILIAVAGSGQQRVEHQNYIQSTLRKSQVGSKEIRTVFVPLVQL
jgi:type I restriction enzyme M protein